MRSRDRIIQFSALAALIVCLVTSTVLSRSLTAEAGRAQLVYTDTVQEGDPPEVALGIAMGAFRGLFVNYLWIRANKLKQDGKFYEAIQLSEAITRLQPRFPRVWGFHAWNLAYNISVACHTVDERWNWVNAGIHLLQNEAIPRNPNDVILHKELAWIYFHKIQGFADDANRFYKRKLAEEWTINLGTPPMLDELDRDEAAARMVEFLTPIVEAPNTLDEVIRRELAEAQESAEPGKTARTASLVGALVKRIQDETGLKLDRDFLRQVEIERTLSGAWYMEGSATPPRTVTSTGLAGSTRNPALKALLDDEQYTPAWDRLLPFVRKRVLIDEYNMEPARMVRYTKQYGPFDWRHACSHSVYWSVRGIEEGYERIAVDTYKTLNTDRVTLHSLQELFRTGSIQYDLVTGEYMAFYSLGWLDTYRQVLEENIRGRHYLADDPNRSYRTTSAGLENLIRDAIVVYYRRGDKAKAAQWRQYLIDGIGGWLNSNDDDKIFELTELSLDEFYNKQLRDRASIPQVARGEVEGALTEAFRALLRRNDAEKFNKDFRYAAAVHKLYFEQQNSQTFIDERQRMEEMPRNFNEMVANVFFRLMFERDAGPYNAAAIYARAPLLIQQWTYDRVRYLTLSRGMLTPEEFDDLFPEPPNMAEMRATIRATVEEELRRKQMLQESIEQQ